MVKWQSYVNSLILGVPAGSPSLVVRYEDVQRDKVKEVERILEFLYVHYTRKNLMEKLDEDFTAFQRKSHPQFEHFTKSQVEFIQQMLITVLGRLKKENNGVTFGIEEYVQ